MISKQRYQFRAAEKLKGRKQIEQLFREGKSFSNFPFRVLWLYNDQQQAALQAGFTVGTKNFKHAVDRNRIKRLMREAYRLQKNDLFQHLADNKKKLMIFFIYVGNELPEYQLMFEKTGHVLRRLKKLIDENNTADS